MAVNTVPLAAAAHRTRTGDLWLFRGRSVADRVIHTVTNAPVNHVGVAVVVDDMPPLLWHAEMGKSLPDMWTGTRHRGVQLHLLDDAVMHWCHRYGQRAWMRQLEPPVGAEADKAVLETIARWNGVSFPSMTTLATRWVHGRWENRRELAGLLRRVRGHHADSETAGVDAFAVVGRRSSGNGSARVATRRPAAQRAQAAFCAEVAGVTLEQMGVLRGDIASNWYDPGKFWSGDDLPLADGYSYGREVGIIVPPKAAAR